MKKAIITVLVAAFALCCLAGCGSKEEVSSSSGIVTELPTKEKDAVITSLMGTIRHFEPDLEIPENTKDFTIARVEGHYNLAVIATRPDGSNAMISYWVDLDGKNYSVHYFSVKDDVYVDDGQIDALFEEE